MVILCNNSIFYGKLMGKNTFYCLFDGKTSIFFINFSFSNFKFVLFILSNNC